MTKNNSKIKKIFKAILIFFGVLLMAIIGVFVYFNAKINYFKQTIDLDEKTLIAAYSKPSFISANNTEIALYKNAQIISFEKLNKHTIDAFISIEDKNFFTHNGINPKRIVKAILTNIKTKSFKEGASTISQQLIKNTMLSSEKSIDRKLKEVALVDKLEKNFSKNEILEIYLNSIYFGNNLYGIQNASLAYFNKPASELSLNESAILAGIIKSPNNYAKSESLLFERKNLVLSEMLKDGKITNDEFLQASDLPANLTLSSSLNENIAYQNAVINEACEILNIDENTFFSSPYKIYTYFDETAQQNLKNAINNQNIEFNYGGIVLDNSNCAVIATYSNVPNFINLKRQAGSTIKPFIAYLPAIESGKYLPESFILDEQINIDGYSPKNANRQNYGYISLDKAAQKSLNIPVVKICNELGIQNCKLSANKFGIDLSDEQNNLSIALGATKNGIEIMSIAGAYCSLANNGTFEKPHFISKIEDTNGNIIYEHKSIKVQATDSETAYFVNKMLKNVAKNGTAKALKDLDFEIASKTGTVGAGTINKNSDAYNFAYTTDKTFAIWVGSDNNENVNLMPKEITGSTLPTKAMKDLLSQIYYNTKPKNFEKPENLKTININSLDYEENHQILQATENTPERYKKEIEITSYFKNLETSSRFQDKNEVDKIDTKTSLLAWQFVFR